MKKEGTILTPSEYTYKGKYKNIPAMKLYVGRIKLEFFK